jgi:hypothetical protein
MITILCQSYGLDSKYLNKFISYHSSIGICSFIFIIDEFNSKFEFTFPQSNLYKILVCPGKSKKLNNIDRQRENYNLCLGKIYDEYVCVLDVDEFLHPDTLKFLEHNRPQSINLPWRLMCLDIPEKRSTEGSSFSGFMSSQFKSISKVEDILKVGIHSCEFKRKGKTIGIQKCLNIPINHYYIRDSLDLELFQNRQSDVDPFFSNRISTMYVIQSLCIRFCEFSHVFKLSDCGQEQLLVDSPDQSMKIINGDSIQYVYFYVKSLMWINRTTGLSPHTPIRTYPKVLKRINLIDTHFMKSLYLILLITRKSIKELINVSKRFIRRVIC